ncbi:MAG: hypothetical protein H6816_11385 [Phycisphaerales bacterium]|nr:hypothetical protein [Phycisphaerales bacterium]
MTESLRRHRRPAHAALTAALLAGLLLPALPGCGRYGGLAYFMGIGRGHKIEPQFELPEDGTLLVLVDDPAERLRWPRLRDLLEQSLGEELLAHQAVKAVISPDAMARFRQADPKFERYPAATIGRKVGADTVLWLEVRDFFNPTEIEDTSSTAKITLAVKVITTKPGTLPSDVRLWPTDEGGYIHSTELSAIDVHKLKGDNATARELARRAAIQIGRLFYQHTVGEVEDSKV